ncbi:BYS1 domain-containing protein [Blastomyces gilchristii SLH14081]|uniref:BYS1 domain-containing protein n=1 Tax=Blastomyces gilchristii (strain SLH14081) TaxID=559298 RepID=A0A179UH65_BLAGS|nr:BYS1 domain-containing protein [Blastomyces gilchristii SLH14081]OAT07385.1 BYS1 domain-containing protein [Blastomyces gilchristii SLH14081]
MRLSSTFVGALAALAPTVQAVGKAIVVNYCPFDVYLNSVGSEIGPEQHLKAYGGTYSELFRHDPRSGGIAIKLTLEPGGLLHGAPQTIFAYNLVLPVIWYDLSDVFGDPFAGYPLKLAPSDPSCPVLFWPDGIPPGPSQVRNCQSKSDLTLTLCAYPFKKKGEEEEAFLD